MKSKRESFQITLDILKAIQMGKTKPTHIIYKANLSNQMLVEYMKDLLSNGFVVEKKNPKGRTYALTDKGRAFIKEYKLIQGFMESYGFGS
jgi:predicted transcriptional regulator